MQLRTVLALAAALLLASPAHAQVKNIILMVADGAGYNTLAATRFWRGAPLPTDSDEWVRASQATYGLRESAPTGPLGPLEQDPELVYGSSRAWDITPVRGKTSRGYPRAFAGYEWLRDTAPDSANTMSAMVTGVRSYDGAINVDGAGRPVRSLAEAAHASGRAVGIVSSVPFNHATPAAGGGAHDVSRENYHAIARELFGSGLLSVIAGAGNPDYDTNGRRADAPGYTAPDSPNRFVPPDLWAALKSGGTGWTLVEDRAQIAALAQGTRAPPDRLAIVAPVYDTLQQNRLAPDPTRPDYFPGDAPFLKTSPTLAELALAALQRLRQDPQGFVLVIEGGAVDWAMHDNEFGRMIEEYEDFARAVDAVVAWIERPDTPASFENTLLIVTADHDHLLMGPDGAAQAFEPLAYRGGGHPPGHRWFHNGHSNQLVPLFARGAGAEAVAALATRRDEHSADGRSFGRGRYFHQTELGQLLLRIVDGRTGAPPAAVSGANSPVPR